VKRKKKPQRSRSPIAITTGDHRGIGAEVIAKGLYALRKTVKPDEVVVFGVPELYRPYKKFLPKRWQVWTENEVSAPGWPGVLKEHLNFILPYTNHIDPSKRGAFSCGRYIELAVQGALRGTFAGICTGPVNKNELNKGGYPYSGHTELLRALCKTPTVTMMMAGPKMRVTLVTTHEALRDVSRKLSIENVISCIENTLLGLSRDFGIKTPRLAVMGLNPHASDAGLFGDEERSKIEPAIELARARYSNAVINGPFPPDGFFAQWRTRYSKEYDAIVCMYHDQGLIPVKLLDFENTVNVSLGLPIVRTSVDHGVGYDIAGKNKANPASFCAALKLAAAIVKRRGK
jgi:4-hydroxythreonine-4-phosphate dehydrogenase